MKKGSFKFVIPTRRFELIRFLEQMIVSTRVHQLADVLLKRPRTSKQQKSVEEFFGAKAKNIADHGLATLNDAEIEDLMRHPKTLVQLQTWLLMYGGKYWEQRFGEARFGNETADMRRERIESLGKVRKSRFDWLGAFKSWGKYVAAAIAILVGAYSAYYVFLAPTPGKLIHFQKVVQLEAAGRQGETEAQLAALSESIRSWSQKLVEKETVRQLRLHCWQLVRELKILKAPSLGLFDELPPETKSVVLGEIENGIEALSELGNKEFEYENSDAAFTYRREIDQAAYRIQGEIREKLKDG